MFYTILIKLKSIKIELRGTKEHPSLELAKLRHKYGSVLTFWLGNTPMVIVFDCDLARDAFKQNAFSGRPQIYFSNYLYILN